MMVCGNDVYPRPMLNFCTTSVSVPPALTEAPPICTPAVLNSRHPMVLIPLGSVARTVIVSLTSTRLRTLNVTMGGTLSVATDWIVTATAVVTTRRPEGSSANPDTLNVPLVTDAGTLIMLEDDAVSG